MNKGFASVLALVLTAMVLNSLVAANSRKALETETLLVMVEAEQNNFERTMLEQNADRIVQNTLQKELQNKIPNPEIANRHIASNLMEFFTQTEKENNAVRFFVVRATPESYERILQLPREPVSLEKIQESMKTLIIKQGSLVIGETVFTGGLAQNNVLVGIIDSPHQRDFFLIPLYHTTRVEMIS